MDKSIKIKYLKDIKPIEENINSDWIDLRCAEDIYLRVGEYSVIPLGVAMELPRNFEAIIAPRSSTFKKWGIICTNSIGIIDESYKGDDDEWRFPVLAIRDTVIHKNDRICQFRIIEHQPLITFKKVTTLNNENRGGFGSTGVN